MHSLSGHTSIEIMIAEHLGPPQVKSRLLISSNFYIMNFQHFSEMPEIKFQHFQKMSEIHYIKNARN